MTTVLIVDDNPELLQVFTQGLPLTGDFTVLTAADGTKGLEIAYEQRPNCVVIDIKMPELNGYQLARALRGDPETAAIPLIILTALPQDQAEFASLAAGCDRFLTKPVVPRELAASIQSALASDDQERVIRLRTLAGSGEEPS
ncbi:MAG TPA: response regulator [Ktedonobacterales bacterium]|nr:response regulator [Ktedonobacterales bacterium]